MTDHIECEPFHPTLVADGAQLVEKLGAQSYATGAPWSEPVIKENMMAPTSVYWLVRLNGRVVGFLSGTRVIDQLELTNLGIIRSHQGRGIGRQLLTSWLATYPHGTQVSLEVRIHNKSAIQLYKQQGFSTIMTRKAYYDRPVEDALIMQRTL